MLIIKSVQIRKFRSIKSSTKELNLSHLNIFVGNNDQGKSNILRALNLFFNNETDFGYPFRFDEDYCYHAETGTGSRIEIRIDLVIDPPKTRFKYASPIRWTRYWKRDGSIIDERVVIETGLELERTSNISKWLDKLRYRYVPAIKGREYFTSLMGELHDVLNEAHKETLRSQGEKFISGIQTITNQITRELQEQIGIPNTIQVPSDFRLLFSNLDFGSKIAGETYHLKQRGDGIKVRHIPVILKYMSDEEKNISIPGYVKPDTIWGFEEPENNLEFTYAFQLARTFKKYSKDIQIFITTHSPAFYALDENDRDNVETFLVSQNEKSCTQISKVTHKDNIQIHEQMGILPIITPYLKEIDLKQQKIDELKTNIVGFKPKKCFVLTEDENVSLVKSYLSINGFNLAETEFISYNGSSRIDSSLYLASYLKAKFPESEIVIHRDRDYLEDNEVTEIVQKIKSKNCHPLITIGVDIEDIFIDANHINALYPKISIEKTNELIDKATDKCESDSVDRMIDHFFKTNRPEKDAYAKTFRSLHDKYTGNKKRYRYGKRVLGHLKALLHQQLKCSIDLIRESKSIANAELSDLAKVIFLK